MRRLWRLPLFVLHLLLGALIVLSVFPWCRPVSRRWMKQRWSRILLAVLGIRVSISGHLPSGALLLVSNHVSWLDIYLINSLCPVAFVSKADVKNWPLIGWLARHNDTIFLQRGSRGHAHVINQEIAGVLSQGCPVTVFPEGTTTEGDRVLHFHGALLQPALSVGAQLVPLSIRYRETNCPDRPSLVAAYAGETTLGQSLWGIAGCQGLEASLSVLSPLQGNDRKMLAVEARAVIAANLGIAGGTQDIQGAG